MTIQTLSAERSRELLSYDHLTGLLTHRVGRNKGKPAGWLQDDGYCRLLIDRKPYLNHRVVWLLASGQWPVGELDHLNGVRSDNRVENLREVTRKVNNQNRRTARKDNRAGLIGVSTRSNGFRARIRVGGAHLSLGTFSTPQAAHQAYLSAKRALHAGCTI